MIGIKKRYLVTIVAYLTKLVELKKLFILNKGILHNESFQIANDSMARGSKTIYP